MGISTQNLRALVRSGQLTAVTFPGSGGAPVYRFRPSDVDRAIRRIHNAKGFSPIYSKSVWKAPPPRPRSGMAGRGRPRIAFDLARAEELRKAGKGYVEIAREVGVSSTTVANALRTGRREILSGPGRRSVEFDLDKAIALRRAGKTFVDIAAELGGISPGTLSNAVRAAAPELTRPPGFRDRDAVARMLTMRREGASYRQIGEAFGLRADAVARGLKALGIHTPPIRRGAPRAQIDIPRALQMRRDGFTYARIAQEFGVNTATMARAIRDNSGLKGSMFAFDIKRAMEMRRQGHGYAAIAKAVGVSRPTVTNAIKLKMLSEPARNSEPPFEIEQAAQMRRERKSYKAIGAALGVSAHTVAIHLKRSGMEVKVQLSPRFDLDLARRLRGEGVALAEIARQCGVSISTVARYLGRSGKPSPKVDTPGEPSRDAIS